MPRASLDATTSSQTGYPAQRVSGLMLSKHLVTQSDEPGNRWNRESNDQAIPAFRAASIRVRGIPVKSVASRNLSFLEPSRPS